MANNSSWGFGSSFLFQICTLCLNCAITCTQCVSLGMVELLCCMGVCSQLVDAMRSEKALGHVDKRMTGSVVIDDVLQEVSNLKFQKDRMTRKNLRVCSSWPRYCTCIAIFFFDG